MKRTLKKILAAVCIMSMLLALQEMTVSAEELHEDMVLTDAEYPEETVEESADDPFNEDELTVTAADPETSFEEDMSASVESDGFSVSEDVVGSGEIEVGDDVTAIFDEGTGSVVLSSEDGVLWSDWIDQSGLAIDKIKSIRVGSGTVYLPEDANRIFAVSTYDPRRDKYVSNLSELDLNGFDTSYVESMDSMFEGCNKLTSLDLSGFDTANVWNMNCMFNGCGSLKELNLSSFDTSNVEDMWSMFADCSSLEHLDVSGFATSNVTDMGYMFFGCSSLEQLEVGGFDTSNVTDMGYMFSGCSSLGQLDLAGYVTTNVTDMGYMFSGCSNMKELNLSSFNTPLVTDMSGMFSGCSSLTEVDLRNADTSNLDKNHFEDGVFEGCSALLLIRTPKKNSLKILLPVTMYDQTGKEFTELTTLSASITLTRQKPSATVSGFSDVQDPNHAYYKAIYWAAGEGITKGYSDGTFGINRSCTRGEMIMFLWRYMGKPTPKAVAKSPFKDVPTSHTFFKAVIWAYQNGVTKGYSDGTFGINRNVSRGECMMFLWRVKGKPAPRSVSKSPFSDVATTNAFYNAILWGYQNKITTGYSSGPKKGTFGINDNCTRGQIVTFLYRAR